MILFRNEYYCNSKVRDALAIFVHEIAEQRNQHILLEWKDDCRLSEQLRRDLDKLSGLADGDLSVSEMEKIATPIGKRFLSELSKIYDKKIRYAIYLGSLDDVIREYEGGIDGEANISAFVASDVILANLESEGALYGYEEKPVSLYGDLTVEEARKVENGEKPY